MDDAKRGRQQAELALQEYQGLGRVLVGKLHKVADHHKGARVVGR
jgi:hypothetical protein